MSLKTGEAGGPYKLDIINGNNKVSFQDVLIGDVWLAGGQSNMEFALRRVKDAQKEISSADYPQIRYYKVPRKFYPEQEVSKASWRVCSPQTAPEFSAIAYYFSRNIHKELNIHYTVIMLYYRPEVFVRHQQCPACPGLHRGSSYRSLDDTDRNIQLFMYVSSLAEYNQLNAEQKKYIDKPVEPMGRKNFHRPIGLSETMLNTVIPYTLKGFLFYQGESNTALYRHR